MTRILTGNSHDIYCDSRQTDKAIINLAIRSFSAEVQKLLIMLLNKANAQIQEAHESQHGQEFLQGEYWAAVLSLILDACF